MRCLIVIEPPSRCLKLLILSQMANKGYASHSVENDYGRTLAEAEGTDVKKVDDTSHSW